MRKLSIQQCGTNLAAEAVPFSMHLKDGVDLSPAPMVHVPNLGEKVFQLLDQNERLHTYILNNQLLNRLIFSAHRLTWHGGVIPEEEIWLKIGGDKGEKSVKTSFQICNTPNPNSVQNTVVFSVFEAKDTPVNLHIALDRYHEQVEALQKQSWRYADMAVIHNTVQNHIINTGKSLFAYFCLGITSFCATCMA